MASTPAPSTTPPVGPSTVATSGGALVAFGLAVWAFIHGDRSTETIAALGTGLGLILALVVSRTSQANKLAERLPAPPAPAPLGVALNSAVAGEPVTIGLDAANATDATDPPPWPSGVKMVGDSLTVVTPGPEISYMPPWFSDSSVNAAGPLPDGMRVIPSDLDDSAHALTDGDPTGDVAVSPADMIDEGASASDPEGDA